MYEPRINRGAALLDRVRPGWAAEIAVDELAMETCNKCLIGQLYGDYYAGWPEVLKPLPFKLFAASNYGFTLRPSEQDIDDLSIVMARFGRLADAWRAAIRERTAANVDS